MNSLFFDDNTFAALISPDGPGGTPGGPQTIMLTHDLLAAPEGVDESKLCSCDFLTWGYWAADVPGASSSETPGQRDLVALGTWVAGKLPTAADIPTTGTASYAGHAVGSDGNVSGNVVGSFARNGSDPVGGVIGDLILSGTNGSGGTYVGVGTIAGQKATGQN